MKLITILTCLMIMGCTTSRLDTLEANQKRMAQAADQNFQSQGNHIQNLLNKVFAENLAKGRALNCKNGFNYITVKCLEDSK